MNLASMLPEAWSAELDSVLHSESFRNLQTFLEEEYSSRQIFPPEEDLFSAFRLTPPDKVRVLILGQDPYHDDGQAHGLAFSVRPGVRFPPSLRNIFQELRDDLGIPIPPHGSLESWAKQGVLLLNTVLTVRAHAAASHKNHGWEEFTDAVIQAVSSRETPVIFVLWGAPAQKKKRLINTTRHIVLESAHPSPLSAYRGFFGSRPFSRINEELRKHGFAEIDWRTEPSLL